MTTPNPGRVSGFGDTSLLDIIISPAHTWGIWGAGAVLVIPTAEHDELGDGKWELGPAATFMFYGVKNWQMGLVFQNPVSIAGDSDRDNINQLQIQPVINYLYKNKWYFGAGDFNMTIDWENDQEITLPLAFQVGRILQLGKYKYNISAEYEWTATAPKDAQIPEWGIRLGFVWLYPE